jgi:hypothetical protein
MAFRVLSVDFPVLVVTLAFAFNVLPADHRSGVHRRLDLLGLLLLGLGVLAAMPPLLQQNWSQGVPAQLIFRGDEFGIQPFDPKWNATFALNSAECFFQTCLIPVTPGPQAVLGAGLSLLTGCPVFGTSPRCQASLEKGRMFTGVVPTLLSG